MWVFSSATLGSSSSRNCSSSSSVVSNSSAPYAEVSWTWRSLFLSASSFSGQRKLLKAVYWNNLSLTWSEFSDHPCTRFEDLWNTGLVRKYLYNATQPADTLHWISTMPTLKIPNMTWWAISAVACSWLNGDALTIGMYLDPKDPLTLKKVIALEDIQRSEVALGRYLL